MKVLFLSTYMKGGAANCAQRLGEAFQQFSPEIEISMLVRLGKETDWIQPLSGIYYLKSKSAFYLERLFFWPYEKSAKIRFAFSPANFGTEISNHPLVKEADIIHLHWVNQGFLSIENIKTLGKLNKPIVWSMHDMWPFTGGCHYAGNCNGYKVECGNCPFLKKPNPNDLSHQVWQNKNTGWDLTNFTFVGSSKWLSGLAQSSSLLKHYKVIDLPTPVDTNQFVRLHQCKLRDSLNIAADTPLILFLAMSATDDRKGFKFLKKALLELALNHPEYELLIVGKVDEQIVNDLPLKCHTLGLISEQSKIVEAYNAADVFVIPSLEDNLPNTVMESLSCGTPVVGFITGGIPEMIDHCTNGYVAKYRDSSDLAKGIEYVLSHKEHNQLKIMAREKAIGTYSMEIVARKYLELYRTLT